MSRIGKDCVMRKAMMLTAAVVFGGMSGIAAAAAPLEGVWQARGDGLLKTVEGSPPPLKPAAKKAYDAKRTGFLAGDAAIDPAKKCKPPGEPRLMIDPQVPFEIVQTAQRIMFLYQWNRLVRMIEMGPQREVIGPVYFGQNAGSWQGDTLVVDVLALHENAYLDKSGLPHSDDAHIVERFRLIGANQMEATLRIEDPTVYARPWEAKVIFDRLPGARIKEDICIEREGLVGKLR